MIHIYLLGKVYLFISTFLFRFKIINMFSSIFSWQTVKTLTDLTASATLETLENCLKNKMLVKMLPLLVPCFLLALSLNCLFSHQLIVPLKQCFVQQQLSQEFFIESSILEILSYFWLASMEFNISEIKTSKTVKFEWLAS